MHWTMLPCPLCVMSYLLNFLVRTSWAGVHLAADTAYPPICAACGVTMVPAALSADEEHDEEWVCLECEELDEER